MFLLFKKVQDWRLDGVADFFSFLYSLDIGGNVRDRTVWKPTGNKKLSV